MIMGGPLVKAAGPKKTTNQAVGAWFSNFLEEKTKKKRKNECERGGKAESDDKEQRKL